MRDYVEVGSTTPPEEDCAQLGSKDYDYHSRAVAEARQYIAAIKVKLGEPPEGAELRLKSHPHDFGQYFTVVCYHDDTEAATDYAYRCESDGPMTWSEVGMNAPEFGREARGRL